MEADIANLFHGHRLTFLQNEFFVDPLFAGVRIPSQPSAVCGGIIWVFTVIGQAIELSACPQAILS